MDGNRRKRAAKMIGASIRHYRWKARRLLARLTRERRPVRVVIFGEHSEDWMSALASDAPVWKSFPRVREVLLAADAAGLPADRPDNVGTVVIPLMEDHARNLPSGFHALSPDRRSIDILADKAAFAAHGSNLGLDRLCPATFRDARRATFPCVLKRLDLNAGRGVALARSRFELELRLEQEPWLGHPYILQAYTPGDVEYVTYCVCRDGRLLWHCSFAYRIRGSDAIRTSDNVETMSAIAAPPGVIAAIGRFLRPLAYSGPCNVDYKIAPDGGIVVLEINPRLGGSLMRPENVGFLARALSEIIDAATP